jgi:DNA primase
MLRFNIESLLEKAFGPGLLARDKLNYQLSCPFCSKDSSSKKKKFHVRLDDFRYHCWVCGAKGKNVWNLVRKLRPDIKNIPRTNEKSFKDADIEIPEISIELPQDAVPVFRKSNDPDVRAVQNYLKKRGVTIEKMIRWRIMTAKRGEFRRRAIIPSFDSDGKLNYYVARSIDNDSFRYKNAKVRKTEITFNEIDINWNKTVILVEGVFDAIKCPDNAIPILGSALPTNSLLYKQIIKNQTPVIISLDPDMPEKAYKVADDISKGGADALVCFAPTNKDLGDMSYSSVVELLNSAKRYDFFMNISHKISRIKSGSII